MDPHDEGPVREWDEQVAELTAERETWRKRALRAEADVAYWRREADTNEQTTLELISDRERANQTPPMFQPDGFDPLRPSTTRRPRYVGESEDDHSLKEYM